MLGVEHAPALTLSCFITEVDVILAHAFFLVVPISRVARAISVAVGIVIAAAASSAAL